MKFIRFGLITALLGGSFMATAEYPDAGQEDWKVKGSDPSEIISRLEIRNEYLGLPDGGHVDQTYLRGDYAPTKNIVFRLDMPLADGSRENAGNHFGMGDLIIGGRGKLELTENLSWMLGTNFILDTALVLEGEFGKVVTANVEVWLRGGGNVAGGEAGREERLGWKAEAGIRYLFE